MYDTMVIRGRNRQLRRRPHLQPAFTLVEVLVSVLIISILIAMLLPSLRAVRRQSRAVKCQIHMRSVAFNLQAFVSPAIPMDRGDDETDPNLTGDSAWLETFQESQYRVDEFWDRSASSVDADTETLGIMSCPEVSGTIRLRSGRDCREGAVAPADLVAYAFNLRLDRAEARIGDRWITRRVRLNDQILQKSMLPLLWDSDGRVAANRQISPHYSAPPGDPDAPYGSGREWFPAVTRHGRLQVAFVGGEVVSSDDPLSEGSWLWAFNP